MSNTEKLLVKKLDKEVYNYIKEQGAVHVSTVLKEFHVSENPEMHQLIYNSILRNVRKNGWRYNSIIAHPIVYCFHTSDLH